MMVGVLDALHTAHAAGVVHRDLKPSNVMVAGNGRAQLMRVMDFGIAARAGDAGAADPVVGTPGYMSPEATQGGLPAPTMDVFSAGLVLIEMLSGTKMVAERDPLRAMQRVACEDLALPLTLSSEVDDALRDVLRRAIEREPARRWPGAAELRDALQSWLAPALPNDEPASGGPSGGQSGALEFLLRRMRHKSDFPALSDSIARIQRVTHSENQSLGSLLKRPSSARCFRASGACWPSSISPRRRAGCAAWSPPAARRVLWERAARWSRSRRRSACSA